MILDEYKKTLQKTLRPRTLCFLLQEYKVLLGYKKRGFGQGKWLGIGGKVETDEAIEDAATREMKEEVGIEPLEIQKIATLNFYFPHKVDENWNQQVFVFITSAWNGNPIESEEMKPQWFAKAEIPYEAMWDDAKHWLPYILKKQPIMAEFLFDENLKVIDSSIQQA